MVGQYLIFLFFFVFPSFIFSGEFIASVNRNQIQLGENLTLNLTLKDASPKGNPSIDVLKNSFFIHSQQQAYNTVMVNGQTTSTISWKLILIPQREGEVMIPPISIDTSAGTLSTVPIKIQIIKGAITDSNSETTGITLTAYVNQIKPYKNEPIIYTIKLASKRALTNVHMQKLNIEDAIVESFEEPKIYEKVIDGINVGFIEFSYLITPLKVGDLKIPSTVIQGETPTKRKEQRSFFDDDFDLFSMIQGFERLQPVALASEEMVLDVQPPVADVVPWLPARSIKIEEIWNESQLLQVGEPLTRGFKIVAEGIKSSQLPSLNDLQIQDPLFKIYADKPELGDELKEGKVKSYRQEKYTLIPQQAGDLTLPEISIAWWDVIKKEKVITRIPSRTLSILLAPENTLKSQMASASEGEVVAVGAPQATMSPNHSIFYVLIAGLMILLLIAIFWGFALQKKILRLKAMSNNPHPHTEHFQTANDSEKRLTIRNKKEKLPDLNPT